MFSVLLPLCNYEKKFNQLSNASGVEVTQRSETVEVCGLFPAGTCFFFVN